MQPAFAEISDFYRLDASLRLAPKRQSGLRLYIAPAPIGRFMASLFDEVSGDVRLLDLGVGVGSLFAAFIKRCTCQPGKLWSVSVAPYEIEPLSIEYLETTLQDAEQQGRAAETAVTDTNPCETSQ